MTNSLPVVLVVYVVAFVAVVAVVRTVRVESFVKEESQLCYELDLADGSLGQAADCHA